MNKGNTIGGLILGAAIGAALIKFYSMPTEERQEFLAHLKNKAHDLLDDAEGTVETVKQHFAEIDNKQNPVDKLFVVKRLVSELFGSEKRYLL